MSKLPETNGSLCMTMIIYVSHVRDTNETLTGITARSFISAFEWNQAVQTNGMSFRQSLVVLGQVTMGRMPVRHKKHVVQKSSILV